MGAVMTNMIKQCARSIENVHARFYKGGSFKESYLGLIKSSSGLTEMRVKENSENFDTAPLLTIAARLSHLSDRSRVSELEAHEVCTQL